MRIGKLTALLPDPGTDEVWLDIHHVHKGRGRLYLSPPEEAWIPEVPDDGLISVPQAEEFEDHLLGDIWFIPDNPPPGDTSTIDPIGFLLFESHGQTYMVLNNRDTPGCIHGKLNDLLIPALEVGPWAQA